MRAGYHYPIPRIITLYLILDNKKRATRVVARNRIDVASGLIHLVVWIRTVTGMSVEFVLLSSRQRIDFEFSRSTFTSAGIGLHFQEIFCPYIAAIVMHSYSSICTNDAFVDDRLCRVLLELLDRNASGFTLTEQGNPFPWPPALQLLHRSFLPSDIHWAAEPSQDNGNIGRHSSYG